MALLEEHVVAEIRRRRDELVDLLATLVGFDTTATGLRDEAREEEALQRLLAERLRAAGLEVDLWEPDVADVADSRMLPPGFSFQGRPQLIARARGVGDAASPGRTLVLNGHVDVVSAEPRHLWSSHPFRPAIRDGRLFGRGACDMKGGVAAMVFAAEVLADLGVVLQGDLLVNAVTDEESSGAGTLASVARGLRADGGLVPETTSLDLWLGARGSLLPTITVWGRPGHAGLTQLHPSEGGAVNAVQKMEIVLEQLSRMRDEWRQRPDHRHPYLQPGSVVPVAVSAGDWAVTYPSRCSVQCHVTYLPAQANRHGGWGEPVEREVEAWVAGAAQADAWLAKYPPRVTWSVDTPPFVVPPDHPVVHLARDVATTLGHGGRIATRTTWFDGATLTRSGTPSIGFGPGDIDDAHTIDESIDLDELVRGAEMLALAAMRFCGVDDEAGMVAPAATAPSLG